MRIWPVVLALALTAPLVRAQKLSFDDRVALVRGLMAEYATVKQFLPRSKKSLPFNSNGTYDKYKWAEAAKEYGPAARVGDLVQITKVDIDDDKIVLQINGGFKGGRKWYQNVQVGGGLGGGGAMTPIATGDSNAPGGTEIAVRFTGSMKTVTTAQVKKILAPVLDFDKRSATQLYSESLPPEVKKAIQDKRVIEGMNRDQVILALGRPDHKSRETKDGMELEDWVFGKPPGKIVFVTFNGDKVIKVKEDYAGLGTEVSIPKADRY